MEALLVTYGYMGILVGTLLEGEATVILGGILAHQGILELRSLILVSLVGTLIGDQVFYYLARWKGYNWACRSSRFRKNYPKASELMRRHAVWIILLSRFLYGLRTLIPTCCGVMRIPAWRYSLLNFISAVLWTPLMAMLGYGFGQGVQAFLSKWQGFQLIILGMILSIVLSIWFYGWRGMRDGLILCRFSKHSSLFPTLEMSDPAHSIESSSELEAAPSRYYVHRRPADF
jgi:membrane protein DedA with SNARE-associated domain